MDEFRITATELGRRLADILDELQYEKRRFVIVRRGREIAELHPIATAPQTALTALAQTDLPPSIPPDVRAVLRPKSDRTELLVSLLDRLSGLGLRLSAPDGRTRDDYVNVHAPGRSSRVLSVNTRTGRSEFQQNSWDRLSETSPRFEHLAAGNKAAHRLETIDDVDVIVTAAESETAGRHPRTTAPKHSEAPPETAHDDHHRQTQTKRESKDSMPYTDESHRYARPEDRDCLMWAWNEIPEVQATFGGPGPWRQTCGGEKRYANRTPEAHAILKRHGATITSGLPRKKYHFARPGRPVND